VQRWEYRVVDMDIREPSEPVLQQLGAEGWELVAVHFFERHKALYMKRSAQPMPAQE
jgi:hypothetical protein